LVEGTFQWAGSQEEVGYTNWKENHPNDGNGDGEHCVTVNSDGLWNDVNCEKEYFFLCMA